MRTQDEAKHDLPKLKLRWRDHWKRTSNQLQRLQRALAIAGPRIRDRTPADNLALTQARQYMQAAEDALAKRDPDVGWAKLHSAIELECMVFKDVEIADKAIELSNEVQAGAPYGWEANAIVELLASITAPQPSRGSSEVRPLRSRLRPYRAQQCPSAEASLGLRRQQLQHAVRLRNAFFANAYYFERIIAYRRLILVSAGMALLAGALGLLLASPDTWDTPDYRIALGSAIAGMIGAVTSASQRLVAQPDTAAPVDLGSFTAVVVRLFIGSVAALSVYLAQLGGFINFPDNEVAMLLLASFGVGFAERLVVYHPPQATPHPTGGHGASTLPRRV